MGSLKKTFEKPWPRC